MRAVYDLRVTSCSTSHVADVTSVSSSSLGYMSNTLQGGSAGGRGPGHMMPSGRVDCPWRVHGEAGQRVELWLVLLGHLRHPRHCPSIIVAEPRDVIIDTLDGSEHQTFNVCSTVTRQRHLYTTSGHVLIVYTSTNGSSRGQDLGHDPDDSTGRRFLLMYKSL